LDKKEIIKSIIKSKLNLLESIDVSNHIIKEISNEITEKFMNTNNIFGYKKSKINLGLFVDNTLISVMSIQNNEITRFCSIINYKINSFNLFLNKQIVFYVDKRLFSGSSLDLKYIKDISPRYWYVKNRLRHDQKEFRKYKLSEILNVYDPNITEWQNMQLNGYDRIWDCGKSVFILPNLS